MDQNEEQEQGQEQETNLRIQNYEFHHNNENWIDRLVPLNEKKIWIYFEGGDWILYDISKEQEEREGKIANNVKVFFQIWEGTLFYVDPDTLTVRLIDLNTGQINAGYEFPASHKHNAQSDLNTKETISEKLLVGLTEYQGNRFLVTIEQQRQYSYESPAIIQVRQIKDIYDNGDAGLDQVLFKYEYANTTEQTEMFNYNTDPSSLVLFGQEFENGYAEFALIKPHLGNKGLRVIKVQDEVSYILMNVTNWISDNQIAIWLNNNLEDQVPIIYIIDERLYYDSENNEYRDGEIFWKAEKVETQFQADPLQQLIDVIVFPYGCQYSVLQRLVGVQPHISLIDWKNHRLVHEFQLGDWNYATPQNRDYIILYDDNQGSVKQLNFNLIETDFKPRYAIDPRFHLLQYFEKYNIIEKYGIDSLFEIFSLIGK